MKTNREKKTTIDMELSVFEIPPAGDVLVLARHCPIGQEAARRMLEAVAPDQFEFIEMDDEIVETIVVRKHLLLRVEKKRLLKAILEEAKPIMGPNCMLTIRCSVKISVKKDL